MTIESLLFQGLELVGEVREGIGTHVSRQSTESSAGPLGLPDDTADLKVRTTPKGLQRKKEHRPRHDGDGEVKRGEQRDYAVNAPEVKDHPKTDGKELGDCDARPNACK